MLQHKSTKNSVTTTQIVDCNTADWLYIYI